MRKTVVVFLICMVAIAFGLVAVRRDRGPQEVHEEKVPGGVSLEPIPGPSPQANRLAEDERRAYEKEIQHLKSQLEATASGPQTTNTHKSVASKRNKSPLAGISEMMKNPGMKEMIRAQQKAAMEISYGSLFKYLQLPEEDRDRFKELLLEKQMALVDISLGIMGGSTTPEERKAAGKRIQDLTNAFNDKIKAFLGEENYEVYGQYEKTQGERMQVNFFKQSLSTTDQLSEQQEHDLILAMHQERTNFQFSVNYENQYDLDVQHYSKEALAKYMEELSGLEEKYLSKASEILTAAQLGQFKLNQKQMKAMQEMGLKMAGQMFGPQDESPVAESPAK